ncbi:hypothetical protein PSTT_00150, partial [Puccinia striiformis]
MPAQLYKTRTVAQEFKIELYHLSLGLARYRSVIPIIEQELRFAFIQMSANRRIAKEFTDLQTSPIKYVTIEPDESNVLHWTGVMEGPVGSCYEGGKFKIEATFPLEYPFKAPTIKFITKIYHPNITAEGLLCIGLLKPDAWKPSIRIEHVLRAIVNLLVEPNPEDAVVASIAEQFDKDFELFKSTAQDHVRKSPSQANISQPQPKKMADKIPLPDSPRHEEEEEEELNLIVNGLLSSIDGQHTSLLPLYQTMTTTTRILSKPGQLLREKLAERLDQLDKLKLSSDKDEEIRNTEFENLQLKLKQEEEKRAKSISLLRAVRQKLVQTEKDKLALENELNEINNHSTTKINELQSDKRNLEDLLTKSKISQEQQLSKLRHSYERENQSIKTQFERELSSKKTQYELDTITSKAAYERELSNRNQKLSQLENRVKELSSERDHLFNQLQKRQAELEESIAQEDLIKSNSIELNHQLNESHNQIQILTEQIHKLTSTTQEDPSQSNLIVNELEHQYSSKIKSLESLVNQLKKEKSDIEFDLNESLNERLAQIDQLRSQSKLKNQEYADCIQFMNKRNQEIIDSDHQIDLLKQDLNKEKESNLNLTKLKKSEDTLKIEIQNLKVNEIKKIDEVKGLFMKKDIHNQRKEGVGYFANFNNSDRRPSASSSSQTCFTYSYVSNINNNNSTEGSRRGLRTSTSSHTQLQTHHPSSSTIDLGSEASSLPVIEDEAELNFEYLRNTLLQFLEHKEMRPHLVRVLGVILHFTPQEIR